MQNRNEIFNTGPEFKPGDKPYLEFGNEILNNNIPWSEVLADVMNKGGLSVSLIAGKLQTSINALKTIVDGNECPLTFKQGARLLNLQMTTCNKN